MKIDLLDERKSDFRKSETITFLVNEIIFGGAGRDLQNGSMEWLKQWIIYSDTLDIYLLKIINIENIFFKN